MYQTRLFRVGYVLGIALVLAGIIYFFAANWSGLERAERLWLSAGLMALFYAAAFLPAKVKLWRAHDNFLARMLLFGGLVSFGAAVALIDQIYNAHPDSYWIFLIWLVPALLFAVLLRRIAFTLLAYVLAHLTVWFYFFPTHVYMAYSDGKQALIFGLFAAANLAIFLLAEAGRLSAGLLRRISLIVFLFAAVWLSNAFVLNDVGRWLNVLTIVVLAACFYAFSRIRVDRWALSVTALAASFYAVLKFIELADTYYSELFYILGLIFVGLLLTGNVLFFRYVSRLGSGDAAADATADLASGDDEPSMLEADTGEAKTNAAKSGDADGRLAAKIVGTVVTVVGITIGTISLLGLFFLISSNWDFQEYLLFGLSALLVVFMILQPGVNPVVRYTLMTIGFLAGIVSLVWLENVLFTLVFLALTGAGWFRLDGTLQRLFTYFIFNVVFWIMLVQHFEFYGNDFAYALIIMTIMNAAVYAVHYAVQEKPIRRLLRGCGLVFSLTHLFWLTFMEDLFPYSHTIFNVIFFVLVTGLVYTFLRRDRHTDATFALVLWFGYVAFKYYDWIWPLLHKSITLLLVGLVLLTAVTWLDRRFGPGADAAASAEAGTEAETDAGSESTKSSHVLPYARLVPILLIIALQFGYMGAQIVAKESILAEGVTVKLALAPIDPRSLMQGDYVSLNYDISTAPDHLADRIQEMPANSRVRVVLRMGQDGVHEFYRILEKDEAPREGEVVINGRTDGWRNIYYGIESYFVPEGDGPKFERSAHFASVRIGKNGDALLEHLLEQ